MSWNNDNVPKIVLEYDDSNMKQVAAEVSAVLDKNGFGDGGRAIRSMTARASVMGEKATNSAAEATKKAVLDNMRNREYYQPSYHPGVPAFDRKANNQRMTANLKDHVKGNRHEIYTTTTNGGYNYSQAFEFGLLTRRYPAHHPFQDAASHLGLTTMNGLFENKVCEAIRRGYQA